MSFIEDAARKAAAPDNQVDESSAAWAARAFSVIAIAGSLIKDEAIQDSLAITLAKAPTEVLVSGTMALMSAEAAFNKTQAKAPEAGIFKGLE